MRARYLQVGPSSFSEADADDADDTDDTDADAHTDDAQADDLRKMKMLMLMRMLNEHCSCSCVSDNAFYQEHYLSLYMHVGSRRGWIFYSMVMMMMTNR